MQLHVLALDNAVDKSRSTQGTTRDTECTFAAETEDHDEVEFSGMATGPGVGMDEDISMELMESTATHEMLKLWPWVNQVRCFTS